MTEFLLLVSKITADGDCSHEIKRCLLLVRKAMTNLETILKSRDITLPMEVHIVKAMVYPVVMYRCEIWVINKSEHWRTDAFKLFLESPLDCKEIKPVNPKGNQPWLFIGRTAAEAEAPVLWPSDAKNQLTEKDTDARKDWKQKEKEVAGDEMVRWHHWPSGHELEQTPRDSGGQRSLMYYRPWGCKELDIILWLNKNNID